MVCGGMASLCIGNASEPHIILTELEGTADEAQQRQACIEKELAEREVQRATRKTCVEREQAMQAFLEATC